MNIRTQFRWRLLIVFLFLGVSRLPAEIKINELTWSWFDGSIVGQQDKVTVSFNGRPIGNPEEASKFLEALDLSAGSTVKVTVPYVERDGQYKDLFYLSYPAPFYRGRTAHFLWKWKKRGVNVDYYFKGKKLERHLIYFTSIKKLGEGRLDIAGGDIWFDDKKLGVVFDLFSSIDEHKEYKGFTQAGGYLPKKETLIQVLMPSPWTLNVAAEGGYEDWIAGMKQKNVVVEEIFYRWSEDR